ncbi:efflux RND transporter permease subunit [Pseudomonas sp. F1_0610]|uniref:efflux RND transporter permease subunit n=1 Tax=Pseudomonas sp. F1_0610 TaxID=3114284 RepID=UPI0039C30E9C
MHFTDLFIRRPVLSVVVSVLILMIGSVALNALQLREYPKMESATIVINTSFPGATQDVMQGFVTTPIAQSIATAAGIEYISSTSTQGQSTIKAKLVLNADADRAMTEVLAKVQEVKYKLPTGVYDPVISKITDGSSAIQYVAFVSDDLGSHQLTDFISRVAQPLVTSIPGVASVDTYGGQNLALRIWVNPEQMSARGLTAEDISNALRNNNVQAAPGKVKGQEISVSLTANTDLRSLQDFRRVVIRQDDSGLVRLEDIATVEIGSQNYNSSATTDDKQSVIIGISPTPDGNPLEIVDAVTKLIPDLQRLAPAGVTVVDQFNVAHFVNAAIDEVSATLIEAVIIVVVVIFLFLGSFRAVIIPIVTIPLSLIGAAALMWLMGFSLNLLTLLAMVLAIGLVVDDAIVVVENIHRHIEEGLSPVKASIVGAREIVGPVIAMTITLAAVYAPIGMMGGLTGALFKEFAFALACSVVVSGVVALTLSPMMSSLLLNDKVGEGRLSHYVELLMSKINNGYVQVLSGILHNPLIIVVLGIAVLGAIVLFFNGAKRELAPTEDRGYVFVMVKAPQYANLDYTARDTAQVTEFFQAQPEFRTSWFTNGTDGTNNAFGGILLKDWKERERSAGQVMSELNARGASITGSYATAFEAAPLPAGSGGFPVQMVLRSSDDFSTLYEAMEKIKGAAWGSGLFVFVDTNLAFDNPSARIVIDKDKAGDLGISMQSIARTLEVLVGENYINRFNWYDRAYDVITQVPQNKRLTAESLGQFHIRSASGELLPLSTVVSFEETPQANQLPQFNQMNAVTLSGVLAPGVTMGQAVDFLKAQEIPLGASIDWQSDSRQYVHEGNRLTVSFMFALAVIFLVLAAQYESFRDPLVILVTVPLALSGALIPLYLGYTTLNIYTQIGLVTLIGLISKHGILMVAFANEIQQNENLAPRDAILKSAMVRMRPILMTTAAMVAGLVPLLFSTGAGAASRFAIGIVVVMGLLIGTLFTLFVLPSIYTLIARDHRPTHRSQREKDLEDLGLATH